jgi:hypothetical protein
MKQTMQQFFMVVLVAVLAQSSFGQRTVRMNIERIISDAAIIVHGTVTKVESRTDTQTNLLSTFVTIDVTENLFGAEQRQITLKMLGGATNKRTLRLVDMPKYSVGQEIVGMFFAPSKSGFTSPVGMGQGTFTVQTDKATGAKVIRTAADHRQLFTGLKHPAALAKAEWSAHNESTIDAAAFTQTVRSLITALKK